MNSKLTDLVEGEAYLNFWISLFICYKHICSRGVAGQALRDVLEEMKSEIPDLRSLHQ